MLLADPFATQVPNSLGRTSSASSCACEGAVGFVDKTTPPRPESWAGLASGADPIPLASQLRCVLGGRQSAKYSFRPFFVVVTPPAFDTRPGMEQRREPMLVQTFIAQPPIEGLNVSVLVLARITKNIQLIDL